MPTRRFVRCLRAALALLLAAVLGACGLKGDLVLPEAEPAASPAPPAADD